MNANAAMFSIRLLTIYLRLSANYSQWYADGISRLCLDFSELTINYLSKCTK